MRLLQHKFEKLQKSALAGLVLIGLTACGSVNDINPFVSAEDELPPPCPSVSILANAERITIFRAGDGQDLIDIDTEAQIDDFVANCIYDVDDETGYGQIDIELNLGVTASRGPANTSKIADLPYFVTITTVGKQLLSKGNFIIPIGFEGNRYKVSTYDEPVLMTIPIEPPKIGYDFRIYLGFQLTPKQLEYNLTAPPFSN
jgi:hypothetical protein